MLTDNDCWIEDMPQAVSFKAARIDLDKAPEIKRPTTAQNPMADELSTTADELISLFEISDDYEFGYESIDSLVSSVKGTLASCDPSKVVNLRSRKGDTLLKMCVASFHLEEEDPDAQLELVWHLLELGADPNLEDSHCETALDWLFEQTVYDGHPLTFHRLELIRLLVDYGGRLFPMDKQGRRYGVRTRTLIGSCAQ